MHIAIIGGGVVGLAAARELLAGGHRITVLDRDPAGDRCSMGNAGGIGVTEVLPPASIANLLALPRLLLDPLGPLHIRPAHLLRLMPWFRRFVATARRPNFERAAAALAAINLRATDDIAQMLTAIGQGQDLRRRGAFLLYETAANVARDEAGFDLMRRLGVTVREMTVEEVRVAEPAVSSRIKAAVDLPQWSQVADPARVVRGLAADIIRNGGVIVPATIASFERQAGPASRVVAAVAADGERYAADQFVIAAGAWSARLAAQLRERVLLESERGYNATLPAPGIEVHRELIFAERHFVATPLDIGLRIGGAAEFAGLEAAANYQRSTNLVRQARPFFHRLDDRDAKLWFGNRPSTPDGLPVISRSSTAENVVHAYGHGHLGLTQSATTAVLVRELVEGRASSLDLAPYRVGRFA